MKTQGNRLSKLAAALPAPAASRLACSLLAARLDGAASDDAEVEAAAAATAGIPPAELDAHRAALLAVVVSWARSTPGSPVPPPSFAALLFRLSGNRPRPTAPASTKARAGSPLDPPAELDPLYRAAAAGDEDALARLDAYALTGNLPPAGWQPPDRTTATEAREAICGTFGARLGSGAEGRAAPGWT